MSGENWTATLTQAVALEYWLWMPGDQTQSGVWGIQIPARREVVTPDLMIAPLLGFDRARYRLGNGRGHGKDERRSIVRWRKQYARTISRRWLKDGRRKAACS